MPRHYKINNHYKKKIINTIDYDELDYMLNLSNNDLNNYLNNLFKKDINQLNIYAYLLDNKNFEILINYINQHNIKIKIIKISIDEKTITNNKLEFLTKIFNFSDTIFNLYLHRTSLNLNNNCIFQEFIKTCKINKVGIYGDDRYYKDTLYNSDIINKLLKTNNIKKLNYILDNDEDYELYDDLYNNNSLEEFYLLRHQNYGLSETVQNIKTLKKVMIYYDDDINVSNLITNNKSLESLIVYGDKFIKSNIHDQFFETLKYNTTLKNLELRSFSSENEKSLAEVLKVNSSLEEIILFDHIQEPEILNSLQNNTSINYVYINNIDNTNINEFIRLLENNKTINKLDLTLNLKDIQEDIEDKLFKTLESNKHIIKLHIGLYSNKNNTSDLIYSLIKNNNTITDLYIDYSKYETTNINMLMLSESIKLNKTLNNLQIINCQVKDLDDNQIKINNNLLSNETLKTLYIPIKSYNNQFNIMIKKHKSLKYIILNENEIVCKDGYYKKFELIK